MGTFQYFKIDHLLLVLVYVTTITCIVLLYSL